MTTPKSRSQYLRRRVSYLRILRGNVAQRRGEHADLCSQIKRTAAPVTP